MNKTTRVAEDMLLRAECDAKESVYCWINNWQDAKTIAELPKAQYWLDVVFGRLDYPRPFLADPVLDEFSPFTWEALLGSP